MMTAVVVTETFLNPDRAADFWPRNITEGESFRRQLQQRKLHLDRLDEVMKCLPRPDVSLEDAIRAGDIGEEKVAQLYDSLCGLLSDPEYRRLVLYLPFEFLPDNAWYINEETLRQVSTRFRHIYMQAWKDLLWVEDVRANFVDGDVLEVEKRVGDLPRVVKAAHLIPKLVEKGWLEIAQVITLLEESSEPTLRRTVADTLPCLSDLGLVSMEDIKRMEASEDWLVNSIARKISAGRNIAEPGKADSITLTLVSIQEELICEFSRIDAEDFVGMTLRRVCWLRQDKKQKVIESLSEKIGNHIITNASADEEILSYLNREDSSAGLQLCIEGVRKAIESSWTADPDRALELYEKYLGTMVKLWEKDDTHLNETLLKYFRRLHQLGVVDKAQLKRLNISLPDLAGIFSKNLSLIEEGNDIRGIVAGIASDPELSQLIYPVVLVFGSRLKGYGAQNSDLDLGVFVRPGIDFSERERLHIIFGKYFREDMVRDGILEFWLEEVEDSVRVRNFKRQDATLGRGNWTHVLFGAAYVGDRQAVRELFEKLLVPYMYDTGKIIHEMKARSLYLEELEKDNLQYRLLHKGYEKFFPRCGGVNTLHPADIDGKSMFWDSGYRQLATKIFINRVFLPKVPVPQANKLKPLATS